MGRAKTVLLALDCVVPLEHAHRAAARIPGSRLRVVDGADHLRVPVLDDTRRMMREFLAEEF